MFKKFCILLLSLCVVFWFWLSFANPIVMDMPDVCYKLWNVEIDNYRVIVSTKSPNKENTSKTKDLYGSLLSATNTSDFKIYTPKVDDCIQRLSDSGRYDWREIYVLLIDNSFNIDTLTEEEFNDNAILVWSIWSSDCLHDYDCDLINTYKIVNSWYDYNLVLDKRENVERKHNIKGLTSKFPLFWWLAVLIEILVLFFIAKIFRKEDQILNKKLLLWWIIPTTITLPLLWFLLPLIIWDGTRYVIIWETLVTVIEAIMIKYWLNISRKKSVIASIICNLLSFIFLSFGIFDSDSFIVTICLLVFISVECAILFLIGKLLTEWIPNKKLVLCWFIVPIVEIILTIFIVRLFQLFDGLDEYSEFSLIITMIAIKLLVDMLIIKSFRKIWRWKIIKSSVLFNICVVVVILVIRWLLGLIHHAYLV